jgi:hypothetical protein
VDHAVAPHPPADGTLAARVAAARAAAFVGREAELDLVRELLDQQQPVPAVLFLHGPGGIGKTTLLRRVGAEAEALGRRVVFVDGRTAAGGPLAFLATLTNALDLPEDADGVAELARHPRPVLLLDAFDTVEPLEVWLRDDLLPRLPAGTLTLVGSRQPPNPDWRTAPGWDQLTRSVALRNLPPVDAGRLLAARGLAAERVARLVALTHGYPLALTLLAEVAGQGAPLPTSLQDLPDLVVVLLQRLLDEVPSEAHRAALEVAAHARLTTRSLLAATVTDADPDALLAWLHARPYVEVTGGGLVLHEVARDALEAELRWRDPERFREVHRRIRTHVVARLQTEAGAAQRQAFVDLIHLHRGNPYYAAYTTWNAEALRSRAAREDEVAWLQERTAVLGFAELAGHLGTWAADQPDSVVVFEPVGGGGVAGYALLLELPAELPASHRAHDPVVATAWDQLTANGPLRSGEHVLLTRAVLSWERPLEPSAVIDAYDVLIAARSLAHPQPAWTVLTLPRPAADLWEPQLTYLDWPRLTSTTCRSDDREWVAFGHDWRVTPVGVWLDLMGERELADDLQLRELGREAAHRAVVLSREGFDQAVREALRSVRRPRELADNPLVRSRVVLDLGSDDPCAALEELLAEVTDELRSVANGDKLHRAVATTYFKGATSQEAAAERLGLPFSTYRRHLAAGTAAVTDRLWERELHGPRS